MHLDAILERIVVSDDELLTDPTYTHNIIRCLHTLKLQAPRPKVLLVVPLASFERTTIGFRLQKLELHFGQSFLNRSSITADVSQNRPTAKTAVNAVAVVVVASSGAVTSSGLEHVGDFGGNPSSSLPRMASGETNSGEADERVSVVLLTRDRCVTFVFEGCRIRPLA